MAQGPYLARPAFVNKVVFIFLWDQEVILNHATQVQEALGVYYCICH